MLQKFRRVLWNEREISSTNPKYLKNRTTSKMRKVTLREIYYRARQSFIWKGHLKKCSKTSDGISETVFSWAFSTYSQFWNSSTSDWDTKNLFPISGQFFAKFSSFGFWSKGSFQAKGSKGPGFKSCLKKTINDWKKTKCSNRVWTHDLQVTSPALCHWAKNPSIKIWQKFQSMMINAKF